MSELTLWGEEIESNPLHHWKGFEHHVCDVLKPKYPNTQEQKSIGPKVNGRKHVVDVYIPETRTLVSVKLQNVGGTAEEKCPYEMFTLQRACKKYGYSHAYIVLGGNGWTIKKDLYKINKLYSHVTLVEYEDDKNLSLI